MTVDLAALAKLASEATPGPWEADDTTDTWGGLPETEASTGWFRRGPGLVDTGDYMTLSWADAAYIAAASPDVVLALVRVALAASLIYEYAHLEGHDCANDGIAWREHCPVAEFRAALADLDHD